MLPPLCSCVLLCFAAMTPSVTSHHKFTYDKPWNPFRRSGAECEMCYNGNCIITSESRCDYYAVASKVISDDDDEKSEQEMNGDSSQREEGKYNKDGDKIDDMFFGLVNSASSTSFKSCVPLVSHYTDCTEENTCTGCKHCSCNDDAQWVCIEKQKCRPEPKLNIDQRVIGAVIENLKKKVKTQKRTKRSSKATNSTTYENKNKMSYDDFSKWMYGLEPFDDEHEDIMSITEILDYLKGNNNDTTASSVEHSSPATYATIVSSEISSGYHTTTDISINKSDNYIDLLEFNDILQSWTTNDITTENTFKVHDKLQPFTKYNTKDPQFNDVDKSEYDPIRLMKRDTSLSKKSKNHTTIQINTKTNNYTYVLILTDALQGLNKITIEKQKELEDLLHIQNNLLDIAKAHNIDIDIINNTTNSSEYYNKHHIAIYKLDTFEKCAAKVKHDIYCAIEDVLKTETPLNSSDFQRDLRYIFGSLRKHVLHDRNNILKDQTEILTPPQYNEKLDINNVEVNEFQNINSITYLVTILSEVNKASVNPLSTLSCNVKKILKRVIKQLYLDDFAVIDFIIHETYYDFDNYLENIGTKWNKMMEDIVSSKASETLHRIKLLYITLKGDISKLEDMITLLDFAQNRRMTIASGATIDKSILRIQENLKVINSNVQKIMQLEKNKGFGQASIAENNNTTKKKSILQKLKKIFQSSKNDIKDMLRKRFPKSEIIKQIAKKKMDEMEKNKMLQYRATANQWRDNLNILPRRDKRSNREHKSLMDRIKNIIPGYLRRKVKPIAKKKTKGNKPKSARTHGRKNKLHMKPTTITATYTSRSYTNI